MVTEGVRTRKKFRLQTDVNLVPVTLRLTAQSLEEMEHIAWRHGATLSEYLRDVIESHRSGSSVEHRLEHIDEQLKGLMDVGSTALSEASIGVQRIEQTVSSTRQDMAAVANEVRSCTNLIQESFEQLFQAFFKLQTYLEHVLKGQGGRK
jgi:hypothetical protein